MMKKLIWLVVIVVVIFIVYRAMRQPAADERLPVSLKVELTVENSSGESGQATLSELDGQVMVTIALSGGPQDLPQPVHLHKGTCEALGEPIYTLSSVVNGVSETTLPVSLAAITGQLPLALNVHKSAAEMSVYVACGEVTDD
ncbi:MAG: hypothetical protein HYT47_00270 [Candidatus Vogelbacteria bacterium]|nr:hypothetical protein [Candidatus Vogelbacteria bacterium]